MNVRMPAMPESVRYLERADVMIEPVLRTEAFPGRASNQALKGGGDPLSCGSQVVTEAMTHRKRKHRDIGSAPKLDGTLQLARSLRADLHCANGALPYRSAAQEPSIVGVLKGFSTVAR